MTTKQEAPAEDDTARADHEKARDGLAAEIEETHEKASEIEEKLDDPATPDAEKPALEKRLDAIEKQQGALLEKMEALLAAPTAPSPRRADAPPAAEKPAPEKTTEDKTPAGEEAPRRARFSTRWWGERAYD